MAFVEDSSKARSKMTQQEQTETKRRIRKEMAVRKKSIPESDKASAASRLAQKLAEDAHLAAASAVVAYWPLADEIDVRPFIGIAIGRGQRVFLPIMVGDELVFRQYTGPECLRADNRYGIGEPHGTPTLDTQDGAGVVVVTPGVAFTARGARLGRGRGFYDRAFALLPEAWKIGVAYECQMVDSLPTEPHDQMMDSVVYA